MELDIREIPFSRRGSYFAISYLTQTKSLWIRDVHGGDESPSTLFELFIDGSSNIYEEEFLKKYEVIVNETKLVIQEKVSDNRLEIIYPTSEQLRIKNQGLKVTLKADKVRYDTLNQIEEKRFEYISYKKETKYLLDFSTTAFTLEAPWYRVGNEFITIDLSNNQELLFTNYQVTPPEFIPFEVAFDRELEKVQSEFQNWRAGFGGYELYDKGFDLSTYIIWSSIVREDGLLSGESIYMSKNWMQNIWSWDNCFNALGVSKVEPELGFNQFLIFVKHQHASGVYPDFINDKFRSYNCVKPPIHAWAYQLLMNESDYFKEVDRLKLIYKSIVKTTEFWLTSRVKEIGGLPYYTHGNDSGWDNASIFHEGLPVIAPDLTAYLIQQLDLLSDWAELLDLETESKKWKEMADSLTDKLIKELYDSNKKQFIAKSMMTGREIEQHDSLILQLPIVISYRLPKVIKENLIENLMSRFESEFGLTTESSKSLLYQVNGYWLGPIWAPETYIFFDALHRAGEIDMSKRIAEKYCLLGETGGMAENYNPETGSGNDDLSFTWTSSVFLKLREFVLKGRNHE
ncbi:amylo-alpha-1,6-glucosidase [Vagococcus fluvialis]|uniref:amylo-alpha-1,6-glucosidase n=1 Tax=Vagococcus fluvialis TaxID=2738 RepID=UPI000A3588A9|nr:trehalase family glycosidase [Vagococcus fluvialis]MBO0418675.1 hypothetical protein [Vagococcus fluvialis]MBO0436513.1 hypothetical protein [Vagococcus fluvialis]OTP31360.1 hypothetical protein A5798_001382 [Enterococcus sp. 6C8_DIV0013]